MLSISGLGVYEQGECAVGADFVCGPKSGVYSCRPCDFSQLDVVKDIQREANNLVHAYGLDTSPALITGLNSCTGGFILSVDGRMGPCTVRTVSELVLNKARSTLSPPSALSRTSFQKDAAYLMTHAEGLLDYMKAVAALKNAPKDIPAPPTQPIASGVTAPGSVPPEVTLRPTPDGVLVTPKKKMSKGAVAAAVFAGVAAVGLTAAAVYYRRSVA